MIDPLTNLKSILNFLIISELQTIDKEKLLTDFTLGEQIDENHVF